MKLTVVDTKSSVGNQQTGGIFNLLTRYEKRVGSLQEAIQEAREGIMWEGVPVVQIDPEMSDMIAEIREAIRDLWDAGVRYRVIDVWTPSPREDEGPA